MLFRRTARLLSQKPFAFFLFFFVFIIYSGCVSHPYKTSTLYVELLPDDAQIIAVINIEKYPDLIDTLPISFDGKGGKQMKRLLQRTKRIVLGIDSTGKSHFVIDIPYRKSTIINGLLINGGWKKEKGKEWLQENSGVRQAAAPNDHLLLISDGAIEGMLANHALGKSAILPYGMNSGEPPLIIYMKGIVPSLLPSINGIDYSVLDLSVVSEIYGRLEAKENQYSFTMSAQTENVLLATTFAALLKRFVIAPLLIKSKNTFMKEQLRTFELYAQEDQIVLKIRLDRETLKNLLGSFPIGSH